MPVPDGGSRSWRGLGQAIKCLTAAEPVLPALSGLCCLSLTEVSAAQMGLGDEPVAELAGLRSSLPHTLPHSGKASTWDPAFEKALERGFTLVFCAGRGSPPPIGCWCLGWIMALAEASVVQL